MPDSTQYFQTVGTRSGQHELNGSDFPASILIVQRLLELSTLMSDDTKASVVSLAGLVVGSLTMLDDATQEAVLRQAAITVGRR